MSKKTFLEICQDTVRECGITSGAPSTVTGQTGETLRFIKWVIDAWKEIQLKHPNWRWMRVTFTLNTVSGTESYAFGDCIDSLTGLSIARFRRWLLNDPDDPPKIYLSSAGKGTEGILSWLPWDSYKALYKLGSPPNSFPAYITVDPQNNIVLGPTPDDTYVITGDFDRGIQVLAADADEPDLPEGFETAIMYWAMRKYALYESAPEVLERWKQEGRPMIRRLEANQLPNLYIADAMAEGC